MSPHPVPSLGERAAGVLLHPTSLPGPHGSGDCGQEALDFLDFLKAAGQRWWQMLPIAPPGYGSSPYQAQSAMAGNPLLIDPDELVERGILDPAHLENPPAGAADRVDFRATTAFREGLLLRAFAQFQARPARDPMRARLEAFRKKHRAWLADWALFAALKRAHGGGAWIEWPAPLRSRQPAALRDARKTWAADIAFHEFVQWLFDEQWTALRRECAGRGIGLLGDLPIFVAHDSADVWAHPDIFRLDKSGQPTVIAGVPPDYFSATGQRWGNPLYRWDVLEKRRYDWWILRFRQSLERFDAVRLDHFIGFQRYWEIPASEATAVKGRWVAGPGPRFFQTVRRALGRLPLVAEDLGAMTPAVEKLRDDFELPGLRILQFAFGDDPSAPDFLPHTYPRRCVAYTGTHDNDTTVGWFTDRGGGYSTRTPEQTENERRTAREYLASDGQEIHWDMIRTLSMSVADLAITPAQDLLGLGSDARMNRPGTAEGNWQWRVAPGALDGGVAARLRGLTRTYGRGAP